MKNIKKIKNKNKIKNIRIFIDSKLLKIQCFSNKFDYFAKKKKTVAKNLTKMRICLYFDK